MAADLIIDVGQIGINNRHLKKINSHIDWWNWKRRSASSSPYFAASLSLGRVASPVDSKWLASTFYRVFFTLLWRELKKCALAPSCSSLPSPRPHHFSASLSRCSQPTNLSFNFYFSFKFDWYKKTSFLGINLKLGILHSPTTQEFQKSLADWRPLLLQMLPPSLSPSSAASPLEVDPLKPLLFDRKT